MYIDLSAKKSAESVEVSSGIVLDYDSDGNLVGIDIDNASKKIDLKELVLRKIPATSFEKTIAIGPFITAQNHRPACCNL